ncbi:MAG: DUF2889 domain-containing protein [Geobacteraceae bacterium]|nr:DUF2889 domain-containing protein [Geobacteraceae bacterium]
MTVNNVFDDFRRDLAYRIFKDDGLIVLTATLKDVFHDIFIEIRVAPDDLLIVGAIVNFIKQPTDYCHHIDKAMSELVGTHIGRGMNKRLIRIFGGSAGCGNIRTVLMGLLPLALNAKAATGITDQDEMLEKISKELTGTCVGYPEEAK